VVTLLVTLTLVVVILAAGGVATLKIAIGKE